MSIGSERRAFDRILEAEKESMFPLFVAQVASGTVREAVLRRSVAEPLANQGMFAVSEWLTRLLSICYDLPVLDRLWRVSLRAASLERRCNDAQKRISRHIDAWHEGMEIQRGCSESVDVEIAFYSRPFSFTKNTSSLQSPHAISPL